MSSFLSPDPAASAPADNLLALLNSSSIRTKQAMIEMQQLGIKGLWRHKTLTPQQVCDALGSGSAARFVFQGILTTALMQMQGAERALQGEGETPIDYGLLWPSKQWTVNPDGTVTIGSADYVVPG
jgi:hypothetical protein